MIRSDLPERLGWKFIPLSLLFWIFLWPVGLAWWAWHAFQAWRAPGRVGRLLRWYPPRWRERYGDEFAELLRESLADGRGGVRLWWDVARSGVHERLRAPDRDIAVLLLSAGWIPLVPQGIVALVLPAAGVEVKSWFLALYLPEPLQQLTAAAMILLGLAMLGTGLRMARRLQTA